MSPPLQERHLTPQVRPTPLAPPLPSAPLRRGRVNSPEGKQKAETTRLAGGGGDGGSQPHLSGTRVATPSTHDLLPRHGPGVLQVDATCGRLVAAPRLQSGSAGRASPHLAERKKSQRPQCARPPAGSAHPGREVQEDR